MQQLVNDIIRKTVQKVSAYAATQLVKVEMGDNDNQIADKTGKKKYSVFRDDSSSATLRVV